MGYACHRPDPAHAHLFRAICRSSLNPAPQTAGMDEELWGKINRNSRKSLLGGVKKGFSREYGTQKVSKLRVTVSTAAAAAMAEEAKETSAPNAAPKTSPKAAAKARNVAVEVAAAEVARRPNSRLQHRRRQLTVQPKTSARSRRRPCRRRRRRWQQPRRGWLS